MKKNYSVFMLGMVLLILGFMQQISAQKTFVHPGIPFTQSDLDNLKVNINQEPWLSGFNALQNDSKSKLSYTMAGPFATVTRSPDLNNIAWRNDMVAIHNLTFMYVFTGNAAYAAKATQILDAWAVTNTVWGGGENMLDIGDYTPYFITAADILKSTYPGWTAANTTHVNNYFANVLYPASWVPNPLRDCNKGAIQLQIALGIAAFLDDETKWNQAIEVYRMDAGGGLRNSIPSGQVGDTGRDDHWYVQAAALTWGAEVAFKQGIDMFAEMNNRILAIGEYYNQYAINPSGVSFTPYGGYSTFWTAGFGIPTGARHQGAFNNIIQGAYSLRKGIPTPYTDQMRTLVGEGSLSFLYLKSADTSTAAALTPIVYPSENVVPSTYFSNMDIGITGIKGSTNYNSGIWTAKGAGTAAANSNNFTFKPIKGDAAIVAKIENNSITNALSGLMIRESLSATSNYVSINFNPTSKAVSVSGLGATAANSGYIHYSTNSSWWLKLERVGNRMFAYHSADGTIWTNIGLFIISLPTDAYIGFYTASQNSSALNIASFSNVSINNTYPPGSPEINSVTEINPTVGSPLNFSVTATTTPNNYAATALPDGLSINPTTGAISGTPTTVGKNVVLLEATNSYGTGKSALVIDVISNQSAVAINNLAISSANSTIKLTWTATANATSYSVKRSLTSGGPYTTIQTGVTGTTFTDPLPAYEVNNYYVVTTLVGTNESTLSNEVFGSIPPAVPSNVIATNSNNQVNLTWNIAEGASTYKIKRATTSGGSYTEIATVSTNTYTDTNVSNDNAYYYVISSKGGTLESINSTEVFGNPGTNNSTWSQTPTNNIFNVATDWVENTVPVSPAVLTFKNSEINTLTNDLTGLSASRIQFTEDATNYTIGGNSITLKNDLINNSSQIQTLTTAVVLDGQLNVNAKANTIELSGVVSGSGSLLKTGTSAIVMSGANTYSGNTIIRGTTGYKWGSTDGIQVMGIGTGTSGIPTSGPLGTGKIILEGGALYTGLNTAVATLYNDIEVPNGKSGYFYERMGALNLYGKLSGSGVIYNDGSDNYATISLYGNNSNFTGTFVTKLRSGNHRLAFMVPQSGSANAAWLLDAVGADCHRIMFGSGTLEFGSLAGRGGIRLNVAGTPLIRVGALNTNTSFGGTIANASGTLSVEKVGTGTQTFYGNSTFGGTTTILNGTFLLSNSSSTGTYSSPIIVKNGAFGGSGKSTSTLTVGNTADLNNTAFLIPGTDGTISSFTTTELTINSNATYKADINCSTATSDQIIATKVTLNQCSLVLNNIATGSLAVGTTFTILNNTGTEPISGTFKNLPEMALVNIGGYDYRITYIGGTGNDIQLIDERATQSNGVASGVYYIKTTGTNSLLTKNNTSDSPTFGLATTDKNLQRWKINKEENGRYKIASIGNAPSGYNNYINENGKFGTNVFDLALNTMNIYRKNLQYAIEKPSNGGYWNIDANSIGIETGSNTLVEPSSFPFELVLDIYYLLDVKLEEAKAIRDISQTSTTQEAGKYPVDAKQTFSNTIDATLSHYADLITVDQVNSEIFILNNAINDFKKKVYYNTNQIVDGSYYIKIPNTGLYWTKNNTNTPVFETVNNDKSIQHWNIAKQPNGLYKITCANAPNSYNNYINENAQFATNTYDATWNTLNIFFNGTTHAIQRTQKSGNGYWYISDTKILAQSGSANSAVPSSFPIELVLDIKYALDLKIDEAKILRDDTQNLTTTTQELGKYPLTTWQNLNNAINTAIAHYSSLVNPTDVNTEVNLLNAAIVALKQAIYYQTNQLADGNYYIKIPNSESYWTKNTTNIPLFASLNNDRSLQTWNITKQPNGRYKITHVSAPNSTYQNYINEGAQFGKNVYDATWNSMTIYFNGTTYAVQKAQKSGFGYWYISGSNILSNSATTSSPPDSFPILLVPVNGLQIITFNALPNKTVGDTDFDAGATVTSGLSISYKSSNLSVATIVNGKIHIVGAGTTTITASQVGNGTYSPATTVTQTLTVLKKSQNITFNSLSNKTVEDADFDAGATTTSSLPITYTSSELSVATIVNGKIHIVGEGTTAITASQAGNETYNSAAVATQILTVLKKDQSIIFNSLLNKTVYDPDFDAGASATSLLPITYESSELSVATIVNNKIHIVGVGTTVITASQTGNEIYNPATEVAQILTVLKKDQNITFNSLSNKTMEDVDFDPGASATSSLPITYKSSELSVARIVNGKIHIVGVGTTVITASQTGNEIYNVAGDVGQILTVISNLKLKYQDGDNNTLNNQIKPNLTIYNDGTVAIPYNQLTLRYWVTPENYAGISTWIDYAQIGNNNVKMKYVPLAAPRNGAYGYVEYSFESSTGSLLGGANSGKIQSRLANTNWSNMNENNDYSYVSAGGFNYNEHITMYQNGQLIWGVEPEIIPVITDIKVYTQTKSNTTTNSISTYLEIVNEGNIPVSYSDVKVRYWFTKEGLANLNYYVDYAVIGNSNIQSEFKVLNPVKNGANVYLELGVKPNVGIFYPSSSTGNIQYRIAKSDWSNFNQADDYSYNSNTIMSLNNKVTVYYKGQLIYGIEPLETSNSKLVNQKKSFEDEIIDFNENQSEEVVVYPNPVISDLKVKVNEVHTTDAKLELFNALGMKIRSQALKNTLQTISLEGLPSGIYSLYIINGTKVTVKKIIK